jgi:hypothetical protein
MNPFQPDFEIICTRQVFTSISKLTSHILLIMVFRYITIEAMMEIEIHFWRNWGVIPQFYRKQIIKTYGCCKTNRKIFYMQKNQTVKKILYIVLILSYCKWTYEEALIMSNNRYRNLYLPSNMKVHYKNIKWWL